MKDHLLHIGGREIVLLVIDEHESDLGYNKQEYCNQIKLNQI